jgi:hypothetical protein
MLATVSAESFDRDHAGTRVLVTRPKTFIHQLGTSEADGGYRGLLIVVGQHDQYFIRATTKVICLASVTKIQADLLLTHQDG